VSLIRSGSRKSGHGRFAALAVSAMLLRPATMQCRVRTALFGLSYHWAPADSRVPISLKTASQFCNNRICSLVRVVVPSSR
jgi:hypothetical protein